MKLVITENKGTNISRPMSFFIFCKVIKSNIKKLLKILIECPKKYIYNERLEDAGGLSISFPEIYAFFCVTVIGGS